MSDVTREVLSDLLKVVKSQQQQIRILEAGLQALGESRSGVEPQSRDGANANEVAEQLVQRFLQAGQSPGELTDLLDRLVERLNSTT